MSSSPDGSEVGNLEAKLGSLSLLENKTGAGPVVVGYAYDERMLLHDDEGYHPENSGRIQSIYKRLERDNLLSRMVRVASRMATKEEITRIHHDSLYDEVDTWQALSDDECRVRSFQYNSVYINKHTTEAAKLSAGCAVALVQEVLERKLDHAVAIIRPPGHHAESSHCMGFCIFNNVGIACQQALSTGKVKRILVVDWDVHHGNATQHQFFNSKEVLFVSLHRYDNATFYPCSPEASGSVVGGDDAKGFNVNIAFNDKMGDLDYYMAFKRVVIPIAKQFRPELVFISCGLDSARGDPLGGFDITPTGYGLLTQMLRDQIKDSVDSTLPIIVLLEGGYNLESISASISAIVKTLLTKEVIYDEPNAEVSSLSRQMRADLNVTIKAHSQYWGGLELLPMTSRKIEQ